MNDIKRVSPVVFKSTPLKTEEQNNFEVVVEYSDEGDGPHIVDLSHRPRFDLQIPDPDLVKPFGITVPETPGSAVFENNVLVSRMNATQASLYNIAGDYHDMPEGKEYTDISEAAMGIALMGRDIFAVCEKLTSLDFLDPERRPPFLFQGPFSHVPCQIVTMSKDGDRSLIILNCSRGYSRDMIHAILHAGEEFGLRPAGKARFENRINA